MKKENKAVRKEYPKVKEVLTLIAAGSIAVASILMPGITPLAKPILEHKRKKEENEWKKFNPWRLKFVLKRLKDQKLVEIVEEKDRQIVKITEKGRKRLLKYDLDHLSLTNKRWDRKWRIIIYDIDERKSELRRSFRNLLRKLEFFKLQKSVYLTPYECEKEIEYLRQIHQIASEVVILTVSGLENEQAYKEYFGLG